MKSLVPSAISIFTLNQLVHDNVTGISGILTHAYVNQDYHLSYCLAPGGVDHKTHKTRASFWAIESRVVLMTSDPSPKRTRYSWNVVPLDILGEFVTEPISGLIGRVTAFTIHRTGCVHAEIQSVGCDELGNIWPTFETDVRFLKSSILDARQFPTTSEAPSPGNCPKHPDHL